MLNITHSPKNNTQSFQSANQNIRFSVTAAPWALKGAPVLFCGDNLRQQFELAKSLGYDAVELHLRAPEDVSVSQILSFCEKFGISVSAIATGLAKLVDQLCFIDEDPKVRTAAVQRIKDFIDLSAILKCGIVIGSMRGVISNLDNRDIEDKRMSDCVNDILHYNEAAKVPIYLEVINRYENNYLNTAEETLEYVNSFHNDCLFVHLDTFHMNIEERSLERAIISCGSKLGYIHVADNNRLACGDGSIHFGKVMDALYHISYKGYVSVECLPLPDGITAARTSIYTLKNAKGVYSHDCTCQ